MKFNKGDQIAVISIIDGQAKIRRGTVKFYGVTTLIFNDGKRDYRVPTDAKRVTVIADGSSWSIDTFARSLLARERDQWEHMVKYYAAADNDKRRKAAEIERDKYLSFEVIWDCG